MKIALTQPSIKFEDKEANRSICLFSLCAAAEHGATLALLPEMTLTGFTMNTDGMGETAEAPETIDYFVRAAKLLKLSIGFGYIEKTADRALNKYMVVDQEGRILSDYAKLHPFSYAGENEYFRGGTKISTFKLEDFKISTTICYDLRFPELYQACSKECGLISVAANWPKSRHEHWLALLKARAIENQCYIAAVNIMGNSNGIEYGGGSMLLDPYGNSLAYPIVGTDVLLGEAVMDTVTKYREAFPLKNDRREDLYSKL